MKTHHDLNDPEDRVQQLFSEAIAMGAEDRADYLAKACGDSAVRVQVESLIEAFETVNSVGFLSQPTGGSGSSSQEIGEQASGVDQVVGNALGSMIGSYRLIKELGEGGFGTVYLAEQEEPIRRQVAFKIIKLGMDTRQVISRFETERQSLAMMDHPTIAKVFDAGATENGRPYFVMEFVDGEPITKYCDRHRLTINARLVVFQRVCAAIEHAHQKGVIHRDIKPTNILIAQLDGEAAPKVIDFGIAKAVHSSNRDQSLQTQGHQILGTQAYMSPEQTQAGDRDIDTRSDVYSLGVLLFEMLAGCTPIHSQDTTTKPSAMLRNMKSLSSVAALRKTDAAKLCAIVTGDLDWIVMKAIESDRERRYGSANELSADIERYLNHEPVEASPPSFGYSARKFVNRHRVGVLFGTALVVVTILGLVGTSIFAVQSSGAAKEAQRELDRATEIKGLLGNMLTSISPEVAKGRDTSVMRSLLEESAERITNGEITDDIVRAEISSILAQVYLAIGDAKTAEPFARSAFATRELLLGVDAPDTMTTRGILADVLKELGERDASESLYVTNIELLSKANGLDIRQKFNFQLGYFDLLVQDAPDEQVTQQLKEFVEQTKSRLGEKDPDALRAAHLFSTYLVKMGSVSEAEMIMTKVTSSFRVVLGDDAPETILAINSLGTHRIMLGRLDEAEPLVRESIERSKRVFGEGHPRVPATMNNLAYLLLRRGAVDEALQVSRDAVELQSSKLGVDHPDLIQSRVNLGSLLASTRRFEEATVSMTSTLEASKRVLGERHPHSLRLLNNLGGMLTEQGRIDEALPLIEESLKHKRDIQGPEHHDTLRSMINLATIYHQQGNVDQAIELFTQVYAVRSRTLDSTDPDRLRSAAYLAPVLLEQGKSSEVIELINSELPGARIAWFEQSPDELANMLSLIGQAAQIDGDLSGALIYLFEAFSLVEADPSLIERQTQLAGQLVGVYEILHVQEPQSGFDAKADRFRAILGHE